jgi:hypothetical protein
VAASYAAERARLMFGCYRKGDANDPDIYVAAITLVLAAYPEHVIRAITAPDCGLPSKKSFLPSAAEVREACDEYIRPELDHKKRQARISEQLKERKFLEEPSVKVKYPTYESMLETYPEWMKAGLRGENPDKPVFDPVKAMAQLASVGITKEIFDAIPNQKDYDWKKPALNIPAKPEEPNPFEK